MFTIGIIGRPNVGKSTLFNRIAGKRLSITDDRPGVTRDRIETVVDWEGKTFAMVDTPGFDLKEEIIKKEMQQQFYLLLDLADEFIVVVDGSEGVHPLDQIVVRMLLKKGKPFILAVNKIDNTQRELMVNEFYSLGAKEIFPISATHGRGVGDLLDRIVESVYDEPLPEEDENCIRIAVIGKPNVGKSSLINAWLGFQRVIVTPVAGTTRDTVDSKITVKGQDFIVIDTAGIRKKSVMFKDPIEKIGYYKAMDAIGRCHIAVCLIDGTEGLNDRDVKVISDAWEAGKPVVLCINKSDLLTNDNKKALREQISDKLHFLSSPPVIFISALNSVNTNKIFDTVVALMHEYDKRVSTSKVNEVLEIALQKHQPPVVHNRRLKFYYMTQVASRPPQFVVFVNFPKAVHFSYQRFLINEIRESFGFKGVPVRLSIRQRKNTTAYEDKHPHVKNKKKRSAR